MCEKCLISSQVELNLSLAEKAKAEAVATLVQSMQQLENAGRTELTSKVAGAIEMVLPQPEQAVRGGSEEASSAEAAAADPLADLPPELRDLLEVLGGKGVQVEVVRFPRS